MGDPPSEDKSMSEVNKETNKEVPVVGRNSPAGPRWFVSKNPGLVLEVVPERYPDRDGNRAKFIRVMFKSEAKSDLHQGDGLLGSRNKLGTDTNANKHYGLFFIMDPGPMPKDGYKGDDSAPKDSNGVEREDWMRTAEEKTDDRRIIDHIRKTHMYRHTPQKNEYLVTGRLIELTWDPAEIRAYVSGMVIPGMGKPMARPPLAGAPEDEAVKPQGAGGVRLTRRSAQ